MSAVVHNDNAACCSIPAVKSDYVPKGSFKSYAGINKVYVTGQPSPSGNVSLVCVYDIFGFKPQTQQGADILADKLNAHVIMPDFFEPADAWPVDEFPPQTDEEKGKLQHMLSSADVIELKVPLALYPSLDEPQDEYKKISDIVSKKPFADKNDSKVYETFHGFAAARADLNDPKQQKDFQDVYGRLVAFFGKANGTPTH
ncbi:hypothetical protein DAEQUDRAFT_672929 [Daedalea quercina L-15889]|uniref:Dienelactone hydrolase domain-containing protein n=1 Tax=Daedalea quercina L-15889 TaxID=1314783 RepID=A0A165P0A4_9APHY|nr:hypothetical protein DAEQUDRAFT_672929 [Daedalea quercina L-15889]